MRRYLHDLTVFAAVTAAGGYALTRATIPAPPASAFATKPLVVERPAAPLDEAMDVLRVAPTFASASVGYEGTVPPTVVAWLTILSEPTARNLFQDVLRTATPAGQMYALAGLRAIDVPLFLEVARPLRRTQMPVNILVGTFASLTSSAEILHELDRGMWIGEFVRASRSRYFGDLPWPANH